MLWPLGRGTRCAVPKQQEGIMASVTEGGAVFGAEEVFSGTLHGQDLTVHGGFDGEVELKGRLKVTRGGRVRAKVKAAAVDLEGEFDGEIRTETLTVAETARARGTFVAKRISVKEGALIEGAVNPPGEARTGTPASAPARTSAPSGGPSATSAGSSPSGSSGAGPDGNSNPSADKPKEGTPETPK
jgi:cytoskeletal protein CcmA (bactofilin family)